MFLLPGYLAITMEHAGGGDLFQLVGKTSGMREVDAKWYFQQLLVAIDYCHRMVRVGGKGQGLALGCKGVGVSPSSSCWLPSRLWHRMMRERGGGGG